MSQENVEIARSMIEAWQRDDFEAWLSTIDPDVEWLGGLERDMGAAGSVLRGHGGVRELWTFWRSDFVDFWVEIDEIRDLGDDLVLLLAHAGFRGPASGIRVESELAQVLTFREGKVLRSIDHTSWSEALKAVRLEE